MGYVNLMMAFHSLKNSTEIIILVCHEDHLCPNKKKESGGRTINPARKINIRSLFAQILLSQNLEE